MKQRYKNNYVMINRGIAAQNIKFFMSNLKTDRFRLVERTNAIIALTSFRLIYDPKTGFSDVVASDPHMTTVARAIINSVVVGKELSMLKKFNQFGNLAVNK